MYKKRNQGELNCFTSKTRGKLCRQVMLRDEMGAHSEVFSFTVVPRMERPRASLAKKVEPLCELEERTVKVFDELLLLHPRITYKGDYPETQTMGRHSGEGPSCHPQ